MRMTRRVAIIVAVICAIAAIALTAVYLRSLEPPAAQPTQPATVAVAVPAHTLPAGTKITPEMLTTKELTPEAIPAGVVKEPETLLNKTLAQEAPAGEPIPRGYLAEYTTGAGLSFAVPPGLRAVTVAVDNITGVGGFLKLGDRVDVLVTFEAPNRVYTKTVLQNVLVLGVGGEAAVPTAAPGDEGAGGAQPAAAQGQAQQPGAPASQAKPMPSVTLAVTPDQAQALVLSAKKGSIYLALRPKSDTHMVALAPVTNSSVLGVDIAPVQETPASPAPGGTQVARGADAVAAAGAGAGASGASTASGAAGRAAPARPGIEVLRGTGSREIVTP
ncbi:MAG: Flp pilus assembly protein CpaB [candidate division WS1 bacterium]|nr:Flp pilus assembly protein CpaB [candidate division WS1 bacterium]